jgi:dipeptidase E
VPIGRSVRAILRWSILAPMRMYLSSFRVGDRVAELPSLVGGGHHAAIIGNALDGEDRDRRRAGVELESAALAEAGLTSEEIDLRDYFDDSLEVEARLRNFDLLWLRGGNVFMLRYALHRARADRAIQRLLVRDEVAYGGYSAGACVLGPTIRGFERTDDPSIVERVYGQPPIWVGLGVVPYVVVPHVDSPVHPASVALSGPAEHYEAVGVAVRRLRDGEVLIIGGANPWPSRTRPIAPAGGRRPSDRQHITTQREIDLVLPTERRRRLRARPAQQARPHGCKTAACV